MTIRKSLLAGSIKVFKVNCVIVEDSDKILYAQRSEKMKAAIEVGSSPSGKILAGEIPQAFLIREIQEELAVDIEILNALPSNIHSYGTKSIELLPFRCRFEGGILQSKEQK